MRKTNRMLVPGIAVLAGLLALGLAGTASAFHGGGVAHCDGCHSMHNSADNPISGSPNAKLLKGSDPSSTCLNCHEGGGSPTSYHILSDDGTVWSPGGDFFWLTQAYSWTTTRGGTTTTHTSDPENMGHNVVAGDQGLLEDPTNTQAPGGTYLAADLGCDSCHDPHGQVNGGASGAISVSGSYGADPGSGIAGNYRLLGDAAYGLSAAPVAVISDTGPNGKYGEADDHHVAYGANMSEWCESCHSTISDNTNKHPAGASDGLLNQTAGTSNTMFYNYNRYIETGDLGGDVSTSYLALVPFEIGAAATRTDLLARSESTEGPDGASNVMCLTCHRAHASAFNNIMRWDSEEELLIDSMPDATQLAGMGVTDPTAPYYGKVIGAGGDFGEFQRSLCNKCHVND